MSYPILIACVVCVWALLSLIGSDRVTRQAVVDANVAAAAEAKRRAAAAAAADADAEPLAH